MADETYKIVKSQLPLVGGLGGHNLLILKDDKNNVIGELDGLATDKDGKIKPIGDSPTDTLKVYHYNQPAYYHHDQSQVTLFEGDKDAALKLWNTAREAGSEINKKNLPYPSLGFGTNSNSVASTLIKSMGLNEEKIPDDAWFTPGQGTVVLEPSTIQRIQQNNNLTPVIEDKSLQHDSRNIPNSAFALAAATLQGAGFKQSETKAAVIDQQQLIAQLQNSMQKTNKTAAPTEKLAPPSLERDASGFVRA